MDHSISRKTICHLYQPASRRLYFPSEMRSRFGRIFKQHHRSGYPCFALFLQDMVVYTARIRTARVHRLPHMDVENQRLETTENSASGKSKTTYSNSGTADQGTVDTERYTHPAE